MKIPEYIRPLTVEEAIIILGLPDIVSEPLAGGTDLIVKRRVEDPNYARLVDITRIPELKQINIKENKIVMGSVVTFAEIENNSNIPQSVRVLKEACASVGSPQIRNSGTLGGNVANAAACADSLPAFVCLDSKVHLESVRGSREVLVSDFILGPHETILERGELITDFKINIPPEHVRSHFIKIGRRNAQSISRLSIAAAGGKSSKGDIDFIRVCPGAATPKTSRFTCIEDLLLGQKPGKEIFSKAGEMAAKTMIEITGRRWSTPYKEIAIKALIERVLMDIFPITE